MGGGVGVCVCVCVCVCVRACDRREARSQCVEFFPLYRVLLEESLEQSLSFGARCCLLPVLLDGGVSRCGVPLARQMREVAEGVRSADVVEVARPCAPRLRCFESEDVCPRRVVRMCYFLQLDVPGAEFKHGFLDRLRWVIAEVLVHALALVIAPGLRVAAPVSALVPSGGLRWEEVVVKVEMILETVVRRVGCSVTCLFARAHGLLVQWSPPSDAGGRSSRFAPRQQKASAPLRSRLARFRRCKRRSIGSHGTSAGAGGGQTRPWVGVGEGAYRVVVGVLPGGRKLWPAGQTAPNCGAPARWACLSARGKVVPEPTTLSAKLPRAARAAHILPR